MEGVTFAISILTRAVTLDTGGRYTEAFVCYQEGLQILMEALKSFSDDDTRRVKLRAKVQGESPFAPYALQYGTDI